VQRRACIAPHLYADDTLVYKADVHSPTQTVSRVTVVSACVSDIGEWIGQTVGQRNKRMQDLTPVGVTIT